MYFSVCVFVHVYVCDTPHSPSPGALQHASMHANVPLKIDWVESTELEPHTERDKPEVHKEAWRRVRGASGVLVPGGFGDRGAEGYA